MVHHWLTNFLVITLLQASSVAASDVAYLPFVYGNFDVESTALRVVDLDSGTTIGNIDVGGTPQSVAVSTDGSLVYCTIQEAPQIIRIDPISLTVAERIPTPSAPQTLAIAPSGARLFVGTAQGLLAISTINTRDVESFPRAGILSTQVSVESNHLVVSYRADLQGSVTVEVRDADTLATQFSVTPPWTLFVAALDHTGTHLYARTGFDFPHVWGWSLATGTVTYDFDDRSQPWLLGMQAGSDDSFLYVLADFGLYYARFDLATHTLTALPDQAKPRYSFGSFDDRYNHVVATEGVRWPCGMPCGPDPFGQASLYILDKTTRQILKTIALGQGGVISSTNQFVGPRLSFGTLPTVAVSASSSWSLICLVIGLIVLSGFFVHANGPRHGGQPEK